MQNFSFFLLYMPTFSPLLTMSLVQVFVGTSFQSLLVCMLAFWNVPLSSE